MKGDSVEVVVDTGAGVQRFEIKATRAGRRVDISVSRGVVEVAEVTRGGTAVRTGRFMANRIIALVEHPAVDPVLRSDAPGAESDRSRRTDPGGRGRERLPDEIWTAESTKAETTD